jgi:hypothetical protein
MIDKLEQVNTSLLIIYKGDDGKWLINWKDDKNRTYSDVFYVEQLFPTQETVAFISTTSNQINYIARYRKDRIIATNKIRVFFDLVFELETPLTLEYLELHTKESMRNSIKKIFTDDKIKVLTGNQWNEIVKSMQKIDERNHERIGEILYIKKQISKKDSVRDVIVSTERDAIGLVLRLGSLGYEINEIEKWNIEEEDTPAFMRNIVNVRLREDQMIIKDFRCFGDWEVIQEYANNTCVFSNGKNRVSIMNANRTPIESTLGVDIIYYDYKNRSYIFVQYKRLVEESNSFVYRPIRDGNYQKDIDLMSMFEAKMKLSNCGNFDDYKLNNEIFYFKLCKEKQAVYSKDLCLGMYLTKEHFLGLGEMQKKVNKAITYSFENVKRYLNNTVFIELVQSGLIGTKIENEKIISEIISELITSGKSLILASCDVVKSKDD